MRLSHWLLRQVPTTLACLCLCLASPAALGSELALADIFTDGAVLQRDREIPVWGTASPGATISVSFSGQSASSKADAAGHWNVRLPALDASKEPRSLIATSSFADSTGITVDDVLVGDVWLCSGQSNMAMTVSRADRADPEQALPATEFPALRVFTVTREASEQPLDHCTGEWLASSAETAGKFSAVAWFFGRELHRELDVPIGLVVAAWSGSAIEAWTSDEIQRDQAYLQALLKSWDEKAGAHSDAMAAAEAATWEAALAEWRTASEAALTSGASPPKKPRRPIDPRHHHHRPAVLFNGMIHPIIPYAIRGAIWYQGETNGLTSASAALYARQLPLMIEDWRSRWQQGDFPVGVVQLPGVRAVQVDWPPVREAARLTHANVTNAGFAVTLDLSDASLLHPKNKHEFAHRLALWARAEVYGEDIPWSGPQPTKHTIEGGKVRVDFSHATGGLVAKGSDTIHGFELRSADGHWHPAKATSDAASLTISSANLDRPIAVRYAWENHPLEANLFNTAGLPATPFQLGDTAEKVAAAPSGKRPGTPPPTDPPLEPADLAVFPEGSEQLDIFLLLGQSNMKGRGAMPRQAADDPRIVMLHKKTDGWFIARHPLHLVGDPWTFEGHDNAGVGPGLAFAETVLRHRPKTRVALVPCAVGGSRIGLWEKGARLYEDAVRRARLAVEDGPKGKTRIAGALWLQGESDANEDRIPLYADALAGTIENLRADLGIADLPFLVSTVGEMRADIDLRKEINRILLDLPNQVEHTAAVDARDLSGHIGDLVHFDTATQNEIGRRFARLYLKLPGVRQGNTDAR